MIDYCLYYKTLANTVIAKLKLTQLFSVQKENTKLYW